MKDWLKITLGAIAAIALVIGLMFIFGYAGVGYTETVGKAQQNAQREVFTETQSYVLGKKQELIKLHHQWKMAKSEDDKKIIESTIRFDFAEFDETKITEPELYNFLKMCKYN